MSKLNVLVVGASIAGPTAAYWFAKAGAKVTVVERFPELRIGGQNVDIRTTGVTVMRKMSGMEDAVKAASIHQEGFAFVDEQGKPFATMRPTGDPNQQSLVSEFEIFRGSLSKILFELTKDNENVQYIFGEQVASMQHKDDGPILVEFANGFPTSTYDLVVACDGSTSRTRAMGLGCGIRDHIIPTNSWAAYFSVGQDLLQGSKMGQSFAAVEGRFLALGPDNPSVNKICLISASPRTGLDGTKSFREAMKRGTDELKHYVAKRYEGSGWMTIEILKHMMLSDDFYATELVQVKVPSLYKGRFVMVGDAGYGTSFTGTGTTLALTGAYILAGEIANHKDNIAKGLGSYEEKMKPIISDMQQIPPGMPTILAPQTAWGIWLRNTILAFITWSRIFEWGGKFFASSFAPPKYELPDYNWEG
ncbi:FAD/NAD(P)-binding domain-containing protein [Corynespora cassiicola Philippines]|uniref:FAD/NAD(P)-binding domain-containing protein n=1 Tax=Corynespora cassiicola Philippines TaxID=1448308 RepID=A0A2T2P1M2_CORCC|nr:FAD/NAD(P)-binding domain-containing protein [Corynespora cassiicola Philippines]